MKTKPIIGISTGMRAEDKPPFTLNELVYVSKDYVDAVIAAGAVPVLLPFNEDKEVMKAQASLIDGLILTGGHDVFPYNYNEPPHPLLKNTLPARDEFDFELLKIAKERNIAILGICRGMQIINVFEGGSLYQDLSLKDGDVMRHWQREPRYIKTQKVSIENNSILSQIYEEEIMVNTFHHQGVKVVADKFRVTAKAADGVVEAIEHPDYDFFVGVQWHPEMLHSKCDKAVDLFRLLVNAASEK